MTYNAKNQLLELLQNLGCGSNCADFQSVHLSHNLYRSTVRITFPDGQIVHENVEKESRSEADLLVSQITLERVLKNYPEFLVNWEKINVEAQAGDALIKLSVYLSSQSKNSDDKSKQLQNLESDFNLAKVFDRGKAQSDPDLAIWGTNLSEKRKATLVEALLWRRFSQQVLTSNAPATLELLLKTLQ
ncbi:hypothetical protein [Chlorogloea sp. CCALA 695]|uniref:hypothetical protein n=1 Tax=Chlorogloea sp. CCALA 695 TaxID=2107693 RepID=UPI000D0826DB|nr:hypothetical protein [Chlorogloea sp. CCALA 695]PSB30614.1 hypothetical protein C7B70_15745 [Chlorogloea sp. CCALA 695]